MVASDYGCQLRGAIEAPSNFLQIFPHTFIVTKQDLGRSMARFVHSFVAETICVLLAISKVR